MEIQDLSSQLPCVPEPHSKVATAIDVPKKKWGRHMESGEQSWQPTAPELAIGSLDRELSENGFTVVHFWAAWNNVDKMMDVEIQALQSIFDGKICFRSLNTVPSEAWDFCRSCRILNLPALGFFRGSTHVDTLIGLRGRDHFVQILTQWIDETA